MENEKNNHFFAYQKKLYLCTPKKQAEVAQLVEHNLAKVRVAGSSPVFRSTFLKRLLLIKKLLGWRNR